jgi:hypothetical protein
MLGGGDFRILIVAGLGNLARRLFRRSKPIDVKDLHGIDIDRVIRHLRSDLSDDWFPDPVGWEDLLRAEFLTPIICKSPQAFWKAPHTFWRAGHYQPVQRYVRDVPKPNGTLRYSLEQTLVDRFVYQLLVSQMAPDLDQLISIRVLSHRVDPKNSGALFKNGVSQWELFETSIRSDVQDK